MRILFTLLLLSISPFIKSQVNISGSVKNLNDSIFYISETGGFHNITRAWRDNRVRIKVDNKGKFKAIIPEKAIGAWYVKVGNGIQIFDLAKRQSVQVTADFSKQNPLVAIGKNADNFNYSARINELERKYYSNRFFNEKCRDKNIDTALHYRKEFSNSKLRLLDEYKANHKISENYYKWLRSKYIYEPYERILVENINNKDSLDEITILKLVEKGFNDEYAAINTTEYNDIVDFYIREKIAKKTKKDFSISYYFNIVADTNILKGNTKNVYLTRFMYWIRKMPDSLYNPIYLRYDKLVASNEMKKQVLAERDSYSNPSGLVQKNETRYESLFDILKKYKGKVIYLDFWASWCIPCREQMPNAAVLKAKLKDRNIVFLYFGYNDKEKAWIKARNQLEIEGEHYLLSDKMVNEADELFGINGIPHYVIINKEGKIVNKRAGRPAEVFEYLVKLSEK